MLSRPPMLPGGFDFVLICTEMVREVPGFAVFHLVGGEQCRLAGFAGLEMYVYL